MQREQYKAAIQERIIAQKLGAVFVPSDFKDIADRQTSKKALLRLSEEKIIRRVMRGIYEYPEYSDFLEEFIAPDPNKVAQALARNYGWTIVPCGNTALNLLGLSTQVPAVWSYTSDGPYKTYEFDKVVLKFKHTTNKEITGIGQKSALVIEALKTLGSDNIDSAIIKLAHDLTLDEKKTMLSETQYVTSWIYEGIKKICRLGDGNA
ncbi:MAG: hypothetical protein KA282_02425 [Clostridia bacterium]|nr:hypothetical protein [Clostridia bacterium]